MQRYQLNLCWAKCPPLLGIHAEPQHETSSVALTSYLCDYETAKTSLGVQRELIY